MIDINTAANVAEIAGGVAILVSLLYVGFQIRQSNRIASSAALQSVLEGFSDRNIHDYLEHPEIVGVLARGHHRYEDLSIKETIIFNAWLNRECFHMQNVTQLRGNRLITDVVYNTWLAYTAAHVKTPGGRNSWDRMKISYAPDFVESIEAYLEANPAAPSIMELHPDSYGEDARAIKD